MRDCADQVGLWVCLQGLVLITSAEGGRPAHCGWRHSLGWCKSASQRAWTHSFLSALSCDVMRATVSGSCHCYFSAVTGNCEPNKPPSSLSCFSLGILPQRQNRQRTPGQQPDLHTEVLSDTRSCWICSCCSCFQFNFLNLVSSTLGNKQGKDKWVSLFNVQS